MGTEVLRPHDCLVDRLRFSPPAFHRRRNSFLAGNGFVSPKPNNRKPANVYRPTEQQQQQQQQPDRKRKPIKEFQQLQRKPAGNILSHRRSSSAEDLLHHTQITKTEPGGRITILRRGQSFESFERNIQNEALKIKTQNGSTDIYAGSGFFVSPSPNSLPLPSFFSNNRKSESDICATRDLRRLLGLD